MNFSKRYLLVFLFLQAVLLPFSHGAMSQQFLLVGEVVSFDRKTVSIKSGNRVVSFGKSSLGFSSYKIGATIKVRMTRTKLAQLKSKSYRRH